MNKGLIKKILYVVLNPSNPATDKTTSYPTNIETLNFQNQSADEPILVAVPLKA
jgi:hypothetical protein